MLKTLIISPNWIGDAVMTLPLIQELYHQEHIIDVLAPNIVAPIYENSQFVAKVIQNNFKHKQLSLIDRIKLAFSLRQNNYEYIYILPNSLKSAIIPIIINSPNIIGYAGEWPRKYFLSKAHTNKGKEIKMVEHYALLARNVQNNILPKLDINENTANETLNTFDLVNKKYIAIAIGAEYGPAKQWPLNSFKELINLIHQKHSNIYITLLGSNKDKENAQKLVDLVNNDKIINLCAKTSLTQAMHIIKKSYKLLTHDSGLMHIAAAIGTELVAIYGSSSPKHTPPLSNTAKYIWLNLECSPCFKRTCPLGHYACLTGISPQQVFEKLF